MARLWGIFALVLVVSFAILGWIGTRIDQEAPPIPARVVASDGSVLIDEGQISAGQNVWQSLGGMEVGSVWGHGSYVAPDWTADWLHREAVFILERWSNDEFGAAYAGFGAEKQAQLRGRLEQELRTSTYDPATRTITVSPIRGDAFLANVEHYSDVFSSGRADYAIPRGAVVDTERLRLLSAFFFWTSWTSVTSRPGEAVSYTQNWPYEPLVGNRPTGETVVWTGVSIILLLAGISAMVWWYASGRAEDEAPAVPESDPLGRWIATPRSRRRSSTSGSSRHCCWSRCCWAS